MFNILNKKTANSLRRLWPFLRPYGAVICGAGVSLVVAAGTVLAMGSSLKLLIDRGFSAKDTQVLDLALIAMLGFVAILALATFARFHLVSWLGERVVADLRRAIFDRAILLAPYFYETTPVADLLSRLVADTTVLQSTIGSSVSVALRNFLLLCGGMVLLFITSAKLTGLVLLVVPLVVLPILIFGRRVRLLSRLSQERIANASAFAQESLDAIRTVQAFGHERRTMADFVTNVEDAFKVAVSRIRARAFLSAAVIFLVFSAVGLILWQGGHDMLAGRISVGDLSAFVFYAIIVAGAVGALSEVIGELQRAAGAAERLTELLQLTPEILSPPIPTPFVPDAADTIVFDQVQFFYPAHPQVSALKELSFRISRGETVAVVGPSGAGKTTLFQLLLRFYDVESGTIQVDGVDVRQADLGALRSRIAVVPQEPVVFSGTVIENIRYGRPNASDEEVYAAAEAAAVHDFVTALPQGYKTFLGEKGVRLSGGQRQRIAIARALLREAPILLLDEATSALDAESERSVGQALDRLMTGRTTLIIAHRLATVQRAQRILVMDRGQIVAEGTHQALMEAGGLYARLAELQLISS
ncbi:MAG: ABC transporter transmembrane domain-containing protein [Alphaproteobacteria bacterium]